VKENENRASGSVPVRGGFEAADFGKSPSRIEERSIFELGSLRGC